MNLLEVHKLQKSFKRHFWSERKTVLDGVSFKIPSGKITGFLGANGAGKTTTMKCILGLIFPESGEITYFGQSKLTPALKRKIGFLPERPYFYSYLTGMEFLTFYGQISTKLKRKALADRIETLLKQVDLFHAKDVALRGYSKGMLQKIGFAQALIHEPELLILDEPMSGLDPDGRHYLSELIRETASRGHAVFLSSHLLHDTERLCENLVILKSGRLFYEGLTSDILAKLDAKFHIKYISGNEIEVIKNLSQSEVQGKLKQLLNDGAILEGVDQDRITLEEYFVKNVLGKSHESSLDNR